MIGPESKLHKILRKQAIAFLVASLLASLLLIATGYFLEPAHPKWSKVIVTLGSSGLGTCVGLVIGTVTGSSAVTRIKELIESTLDTSIHSSDDDLEPLRKEWHHYLLTRIDGKPVWRYRIVDFTRPGPSGKLLTVLAVKSPDGEQHTYRIEGYVVAPRLVVIQRATSGTELPLVHIYPFATERFRPIVAGIACLQTWDGSNVETSVMMSAKKLKLDGSEYAEGTLPEAAYPSLNSTWNHEAGAIGLKLLA